MKKYTRYITSLLMTSIYLMIVFSPLAMQSKHVAHAVTGECSGDCKVDGCSLERSAAHTCCCWQKKKHGDVDAHLHSETDSIPPAISVVAPKKRASCCDASELELPEKKDVSIAASSPAPHNTKPVTIGSIPCGSGKLFALLTNETTQHLPFFFTGDIPPSREQTPFTFFPQDRLTSRYVDPPEPPPQNS